MFFDRRSRSLAHVKANLNVHLLNLLWSELDSNPWHPIHSTCSYQMSLTFLYIEREIIQTTWTSTTNSVSMNKTSRIPLSFVPLKFHSQALSLLISIGSPRTSLDLLTLLCFTSQKLLINDWVKGRHFNPSSVGMELNKEMYCNLMLELLNIVKRTLLMFWKACQWYIS